MSSSETKTIVIIGGGVTGTGIAADAATQGFKVILVERGNLGEGTSGHFHGILHSGARYAVNDNETAAECYLENQRLRRHIPSAITDTGGLFLALNDTEAAHADVWFKACKQAGIPVSEIPVAEALKREPRITHNIRRAFVVPDGFIDGHEVTRLNVEHASKQATPAQLLTNHSVLSFTQNGRDITGVTVIDHQTNTQKHIPCDYVVNAAGVWAGKIAQLASLQLDMVFDKGTMIVTKEKYSSAVLNRCRPEDDGDLIAPETAHSILGTTSRIITDPDTAEPTEEEINVLIRECAEMVPAITTATIHHSYAGVRPLVRPIGTNVTNASTRSISRAYEICEYSDQGIDNFMSVTGGKVTLYRKMAEEAVDVIYDKLFAPTSV